MTILNDEIMGLVKKNLPEYVGAELKLFIEEAEELKAKLNTALETIDKNKKHIDDIIIERDNLLKENSKLTNKAEAILKLEQDLLTRERDLKIIILENKFLCMTEQRDTLVRLTETAFKNQTVRHNMFGTVPVAVEGMPATQYNSGYGGAVMQSPINITTDITEI